jgi:hypothetical protein
MTLTVLYINYENGVLKALCGSDFKRQGEFLPDCLRSPEVFFAASNWPLYPTSPFPLGCELPEGFDNWHTWPHI